jgi:hypothetical protein
MNRKPAPPPLTDADLDRVLTAPDDIILPSSGFAGAVMASVRHQASAPAPLPFPWKRALPGLVGIVAALVLLIAGIASVVRSFLAAGPRASAVSAGPILTLSLGRNGGSALWVVVALAIPLACLFLCRRLIAHR